jgi:nucleoside-diphosphate-sugar epimerase
MALRIFVAGAEGFIGSHVSDYLEDKGSEVIRHRWSEEGDLDSSTISCKPDVIVNCAGKLGGQGFSGDELLDANADLPDALARFCLGSRTSLIHLSTPGVTGLSADSSEDDPIDPWGLYEVSKAEGEKRLRRVGLPPEKLTILRPDFVYGPRDRHKLAMFRQAASGWFPLVGRGDARIRPTYVLDVCRAVGSSLPNGLFTGGTFNVGGPEIVSIRDLAGMIASAMSVRTRLITIPAFVFRIALILGPLRPAGLSRSRVRLFGEDHYVSTSRAETAGFLPCCRLEQGLGETVTGYRAAGLL